MRSLSLAKSLDASVIDAALAATLTEFPLPLQSATVDRARRKRSWSNRIVGALGALLIIAMTTGAAVLIVVEEFAGLAAGGFWPVEVEPGTALESCPRPWGGYVERPGPPKLPKDFVEPEDEFEDDVGLDALSSTDVLADRPAPLSSRWGGALLATAVLALIAVRWSECRRPVRRRPERASSPQQPPARAD